jgi:hypothetical protein
VHEGAGGGSSPLSAPVVGTDRAVESLREVRKIEQAPIRDQGAVDPRLADDQHALLHRMRQRGLDRRRGEKIGPGLEDMVLGVMRRDEYRCKRCGGREGLSLHHKGGVVASKWLAKKGHSGDFNNVTTICGKCHDAIHQQARAAGVDSSQVKPERDQ